ncbi:MAG: hypothetical protein WKF61_02965 [Luteimonas sp.]
MSTPVRGRQSLLILFALAMSGAAQAYVVTIAPGARAVYLRVGDGTFTGTYNSGGTPGSGGAINLVSVGVPAAVLGNGVDQDMTTNATQGASSLDGFAVCNVPAEIYIGGFYRRPGSGSKETATLTAVAPANLSNAAGDTIPFSQISWTSTDNRGGAAAQPMPTGTFTGGTQTLASFPINTWQESCHTFRYGNDAVVASGTYNGRVVYTLSAP